MNFFQNLKARQKLIRVFRESKIYKTIGSDERKIYPKIQAIREDKRFLKYVFTLPIGIDPKLLDKHFYIFEQVFGKEISLEGEIKTFVLNIKKPKTGESEGVLTFSLDDTKKSISGHRVGIVCGVDAAGRFISYDIAKHPHLLIAGETGSGKSSQLRSILTTLITSKRPSELELYLADCKKSEFHIFRKVEHVKMVHSKPKEIERMLKGIKKEMDARSDLTETFEVGHIDDLPKEHKKPYIIVCIDEFVILKKNEEIMDILIDIVCVGRTLGVFAMLSMQRPNAKTLDTTIRSQCTVSMGFKLRDKIESNMVNTPKAEKIEEPGFMVMNAEKLYNLQAPFLDIEAAKALLNPFYVMKQPTKDVTPESQPETKKITERDVFNDVKGQG